MSSNGPDPARTNPLYGSDREREQLMNESFLLSIFQSELEDQCLYGRMAGDQITMGLAERRSVRVWFGVHGVLVAGGNAAKLLWGSGSPAKRDAIEAERKPFRDKVGVADDSPLRSRRMRNAFEHLDDEIIRWSKKNLNRYVGRHVDWEADESLPLESSFGRFDPKTWRLMFLEQEPISIRALLTQFEALSSRLSPWK
jgi:hypothetical protein